MSLSQLPTSIFLKLAIKVWYFLLLIFISFATHAQDQCSPVGWAAQNGGTSGGGNATPITVTSLAALQTQASSPGTKVIYVSGILGAGVATRVVVASNKTIFGLPGATLNGGFDVKNANNVIIRNMIIKGPGAIDVDGVDCMTIQNSTNVWIDHCDISDGQDGNLDIVNGSNFITVTWTKFHYSNASVAHQFCNLIGNSDSKTSDRGLLKVTMMFNYWTAGCVERMPRVRFGQVHVVNNLFDSQEGKYCVRAGLEANILVEANSFVGVDNPIDLYQNDFTAVTEKNNFFNATTGTKIGSGTSFTPPYSLSTIAGSTVSAIVKPCVGATLTIPSICPCAINLPVQLISFVVIPNLENYFLTWKLIDDENVKETKLEYSYDGDTFYELVSLNKTELSYTLLNTNSIVLEKEIIYVRLKFVEIDGSNSYSAIKALPQKESFSIYPNPFVNEVFFNGKNNEWLQIYRLDGSLLVDQKIVNLEVINFYFLPKGSYIFVLMDVFGSKVKRTLMTKL